jgi:DNA-binding response OmpR family regulator
VSSHAPQAPERRLTVLVYSDDRNVRAAVRASLGRRPDPGLPMIDYVECATEPVVIGKMDGGGIDLAILDGEAVPAGGMGIARQLKDEIYRCPPILVLIGRMDDAWLATWSRADAVVAHPIDPIELARTSATLLHRRIGHAGQSASAPVS